MQSETSGAPGQYGHIRFIPRLVNCWFEAGEEIFMKCIAIRSKWRTGEGVAWRKSLPNLGGDKINLFIRF